MKSREKSEVALLQAVSKTPAIERKRGALASDPLLAVGVGNFGDYADNQRLIAESTATTNRVAGVIARFGSFLTRGTSFERVGR